MAMPLQDKLRTQADLARGPLPEVINMSHAYTEAWRLIRRLRGTSNLTLIQAQP